MERVKNFIIYNKDKLQALINTVKRRTGSNEEVAIIITKDSLLWQEPKMAIGVAEYKSENYKQYSSLNFLDITNDIPIKRAAWEDALSNFKAQHEYFEVINIGERLDHFYGNQQVKYDRYTTAIQNAIEVFESIKCDIESEIEYLQDIQHDLEVNPLICIYDGPRTFNDFLKDENIEYYKDCIEYFVDFREMTINTEDQVFNIKEA